MVDRMRRRAPQVGCVYPPYQRQVLGRLHRDPLSECQIWLFADADWAGDEEAKSTSGCTAVIVGPNTYFPINSFSKKQTVISTSSTEAEVVAANQALRAEGLPVLALFEKLACGKVATKLAPKGKYADEEVFTRIDPEINEIRNGNVDSGLDVSNILPKFIFQIFAKSSSWKTIRLPSRF